MTRADLDRIRAALPNRYTSEMEIEDAATALLGEVDRLQAALEKYGCHTSRCASMTGVRQRDGYAIDASDEHTACDCGLAAALHGGEK